MKIEHFVDGGGLKTGWQVRCWIVVLAIAAVAAVDGQTVGSPLAAAADSAPHTLLSSGSLAPQGTASNSGLLREIDDVHNGDRWLLLRNPAHPGGPGVLIRYQVRRNETRTGSEPIPGAAPLQQQHQVQVIHTGDELIVGEDTPWVRSRLEAVAMGPAPAGSVFKARLTIGGKVVQAIALGPGLARLLAWPEVQQ